jgi:hypothetical protein
LRAKSSEFRTTHFQQQRGEAGILACVLGSMMAIEPSPGPFLCLDNCAAAVTPPVPPPTMSTLWCVRELRSSRHWVLVVSARAIVVAASAVPLANTTWANLERNIGCALRRWAEGASGTWRLKSIFAPFSGRAGNSAKGLKPAR